MAEKKTKDTQRETFVDFLNRMRIPLIILFVVFIISIIAFFVIMEINRDRAERAIVRTHAVEARLADLDDADPEATSDGDDSDSLSPREEIVADLQAIISDFPRQYGAIRARYLLAQLAWKDKEYSEAFEYFDQIIRNFASSHLLENAYLGAAAALEELDQLENALSYYQEGLENIEKPLAESHFRFSIGRLYDTLGEAEKAYAEFEQLFANDNSSLYGTLAKSRMIELQELLSSENDPQTQEEGSENEASSSDN